MYRPGNPPRYIKGVIIMNDLKSNTKFQALGILMVQGRAYLAASIALRF